MNIAILIMAATGIIAFPNGVQRLDAPTHVVAVQANSSETTGTIGLKSIVEWTSETNLTAYVTNVVTKGTFTELRDAYVGTDLVYYGGTSATAWTNESRVLTNIVGTVTNITPIRVSTLTDGETTKGVWTNVSTRLRQRYDLAPTTMTNVTTTTWVEYVRHARTNDVLNATLVGGKYSVTTNLYIPAGRVIGIGTAITNGNAFLFIEK